MSLPSHRRLQQTKRETYGVVAGALAVEVASAVGDVADRGELGGLLGLRVGDEGEHCVNESSVWVVCVFFRLV